MAECCEEYRSKRKRGNDYIYVECDKGRGKAATPVMFICLVVIAVILSQPRGDNYALAGKLMFLIMIAIGILGLLMKCPIYARALLDGLLSHFPRWGREGDKK